MTIQKPVEVLAKDFIFAVKQLPKMRNAPRGKIGASVPSDTLLSPGINGVSVETPALTTFVPGKGAWIVQASFDARKLKTLCENIEKLGANKEPDSTIQLFMEDRNLCAKYRTTTLKLTSLWINERP